MVNSIGGNKSSRSFNLPNVNLVKVVMTINLWIFLFVQFFVLVPVTAYAVPSTDVFTVTQGDSTFVKHDDYTTSISIENTTKNDITALDISYAGAVFSGSKVMKAGTNKININTKCGQNNTLTIKIGNTTKNVVIKTPYCTGEDTESTCNVPTGWFEWVQQDTLVSRMYLVPQQKQNESSEDPLAIPDDSKALIKNTVKYEYNPRFRKIACAYTGDVNYVKKDAAGKDVMTKIDTTIISRPAKSGTAAETAENGRFDYTVKGVGFTILFPKNPVNGFKFSKGDFVFEVENVSIGKQKLNKSPKVEIKENTITYIDILPSIDLQYVVNASGVNKYFVLKDAGALKSDLSKITFRLTKDSTSISKTETNTTPPTPSTPIIIPSGISQRDPLGGVKGESAAIIKNLTEKIEAKQSETEKVFIADETKVVAADVTITNAEVKQVVEDVKAKVVTDTAEVAKVIAKVDETSKKDLENTLKAKIVEDAKVDNTKLTEIIAKVDSKQKITETDQNQIVRITEKSTKDTNIIAGSKEKITLSAPITFDKNFANANAETFVVKGNEISIYPNLEKIKVSEFPVRIDPSVSTYSSAADTWVSQSYTGTATANHPSFLAVGSSNATINGGYGANPTWSRFAQSFLRFNVPNQQYESAYLDIYQYGNGYGFDAMIYRMDNYNFSESLSWANSPNPFGARRGTIPLGGEIGLKIRHSDNIVGLVNEMAPATGGVVGFGIYAYDPVSQPLNFGTANNSAVLCSKDPQSGMTCNSSDYAPVLRLELAFTPWQAQNTTEHLKDYIGYCDYTTGNGNCNVGSNVNFSGFNVHSGYNNCQGNQVNFSVTEASSFDMSLGYWRNKGNYNLGNNFGAGCGANFSGQYYDFNGSYANRYKVPNQGESLGKDKSGNVIAYSHYRVDNSSPVRVSAINPLSAYSTGNTVSITVPNYVDDSRDSVVIQNFDSGGRINSAGAQYINAANNLVQMVGQENNINDQFVMEGNGRIRSMNGGKCLGEGGFGYDVYVTSDCQDQNYQKWNYNPETKEIRSRSWNMCLQQSGGNVMQQNCNGARAQKWDILNAGGIEWNGAYPNQGTYYRLQYSQRADFNESLAWVGRLDSLNTQNFSVSGLGEGTWYFRVSAGDRSFGGNFSNWTSLGQIEIDNTKPTIVDSATSVVSSNPRGNSARISPNNPTSVGLADTLNISYKIVEKNLNISKLGIFNVNNVLLREVILSQGKRDCTNGCQMNYAWDGKDNSGNFVSDQKVNVYVNIQDMIGNFYSDSRIQNINTNYTLLGSAVVDNTAANISINSTTHANNSWTNQNTITIDGGVGGYNASGTSEDRDVNSLSWCQGQNCNPTSNVGWNANSNFSVGPITLAPGANYMRFKTEDLAYNKRDIVGHPAQTQAGLNDSQVVNWQINYDNAAPSLTGLTYTKVPSTTSTGSDITFTWNNSDTQSGFVGTQPVYGQRYALFEIVNGSPLLRSQLGDVFNCSRSDGTQNAIVMSFKCSVTIKGVQDAIYKFDSFAKDQSGNEGSTTTNNFQLKSKTYFYVDSPTPNSSIPMTIANGNVNFKGSGERGGNVTIKINNDNVQFVLDPSTTSAITNNGGLVANKDSKPVIVCGSINKNMIPEDAQGVETCTFSIYLNNLVKDNTSNIAINKDGIVKSYNTNFTYDPTKLTLTIQSGSKYFSPNGDGNFDQMPFVVNAKDVNNSVITTIDQYILYIRDSSGNYLSYIYGTGSLPSILTFNGIAMWGNTPGQYLSDGTYTSDLYVYRTVNGIQGYTLSSTTFIAKSTVLPSEKVIIMTPLNQSIQTRGAFQVGGQAPAGWNVDVCVSKLTLDPENCVNSTVNDTYKFSTIASQKGFFNVNAEIPDTSTKTYFVTAKGYVPNTGTKTPLSDAISTIVDITSAIVSIDMKGSLQGVNTTAELQAFLAGTPGAKTLSQLKGLTIKMVVTQNTEAVDIFYGKYDRVSTTAIGDINNLNYRLGTINATEDPRDSYKPNKKDILAGTGFTTFQDVKVDAFKKGLVPQGEYGARCMQATCEWNFTVAFPERTAGGENYELRFVSYKGDIKPEVMTRGFEINGVVPMNIDIMSFGKGLVNYGQNAVLARKYQGVYYTNTLTNTVTIGAEANKNFKISIPGQVMDFTVKSDQNGFATFNFNLPTTTSGIKDLTILANDSEIAKFRFDNTLTNVKLTKLSKVQGDANGILPFVKGNEILSYSYTADKPLVNTYLISQLGFTSYPSNVGGVATGVLPNVVTVGGEYSANLNAGDANFNGLWTPGIYAEDIAGNRVVLTNASSLQVMQNALPTNVDAKTAIVKTVAPQVIPYDASTINMQTRIAANDFSVVVDNTRPDRVADFDKTGWNDLDGIYADGVNPEVSRLSNPNYPNVVATDPSNVYVVRGNTVTLTVSAEKWARGKLYFGVNSNPMDQSVILNPSIVSCSTGTDTIVSGVIVKFGSLCKLTYVYTMSSDGSQDTNGFANNYYTFQFMPIDNAGNEPLPVNGLTKSSVVKVYQDKVAPGVPTVNISSLDKAKPIIDGFTRSYAINVNTSGERRADTQIYISSSKIFNVHNHLPRTYFNKYFSTLNIDCNTMQCNGDIDRTAISDFVLGSEKDDVNTTVVNGRKLGTDYDGEYTITTINIDSAGNRSVNNIIKIERDTVAPVAPVVTVMPDEANYNINLKVSGESGTTIMISGSSKFEIPFTENVNVVSKGSFVYNTNYTWNVSLRDKAGNISNSYTISYTTKAAPIRISYSLSSNTCQNIENKLLLPFVGHADISSGFVRRLGPVSGVMEDHYGIDYALGYGTEVLAAGAGTIRAFVDNTGKGGNMLEIDHGNGIITWYAHLSEQLVRSGRVEAGTVIGKSGSSGQVTGAHLHFQVNVGGNGNDFAKDPAGYMFNCQSVQLPELKEKAVDLPTPIIGSAGDPYNGKTYQDLQKSMGLKNIIDVYTDEKGNIQNSNVSDTNSYITYTDVTQADKIVVYGIGVPRGVEWTARIHRDIPKDVCVVSSTQCVSSVITEKVIDSSKVVMAISVVDQKDLSILKSNKDFIQKVYGWATNMDANGRWSITMNKISANKYQNVEAQFALDTSQGVSLAALKYVYFDQSGFSTALPLWYRVYDTKSNMKAISPEYVYTGIDQDLYVSGDWEKSVDAYYDPKYLDTRIVKLIPVGNVPANPTKINIVTHGLVPSGPVSTTRYDLKDLNKQDDEWVKWMDSNVKLKLQSDKSLKYIVDNNSEMAAQIADQQYSNDNNTLNLFLSWKDASIDKSKNWFYPDSPAQPTEASKWIVSVAEQITNHLQNIQVNTHASPEVNCTGHSLGSLLCNEIGVQLRHTNIIPNKLVALDPPAERLAKYNLDGRPNRTKNIDTANYFWNANNWTSSNSNRSFNNSTAYSGSGSYCGNEDLAKSAQINISIRFTDISEQADASARCLIHSNVYINYLRIVQNTDKMVNFTDLEDKSLLNIDKSIYDKYSKRQTIMGKSDVDFVMVVSGNSESANQKIQFVTRFSKDNKNIVYATDNNDDINLQKYILYSAKIYNGNGADTFTLPALYDKLGNYEILNFDANTGDKIIHPI